MLSKKESYLVLKWFYFCSLLHLLPFSVSIQEGKLRRFQGWRFYLWMLIYGIAVAHWSFSLARVVGSMLSQKIVVAHVFHLLVAFDSLLVPLFFHPLIVSTFVMKGDLVCVVFNELFPAKNAGKGVSSRRRSWKELSILELLAAFSPIIPIGVAGSYTGVIIIMPDMPHLIVNSGLFHRFLESKFGIVAAFVSDIFSVLPWVFSIGFLLSVSCLVLLKLEADFMTSQKDLRYNAENYISQH